MGRDRNSFRHSLSDGGSVPHALYHGQSTGHDMTWSSPVQQVEMDDPKLGKVRVQVWHNLHFRLSPAHPMSILLVERLTLDGCARVSKPMWLAFVGLSM